MNEQELRALVRDSVARHLGADRAERYAGAPPASLTPSRAIEPHADIASHASHGRYVLVNIGTACLIEPSVECTHCGYCKSHGH